MDLGLVILDEFVCVNAQAFDKAVLSSVVRDSVDASCAAPGEESGDHNSKNELSFRVRLLLLRTLRLRLEPAAPAGE